MSSRPPSSEPRRRPTAPFWVLAGLSVLIPIGWLAWAWNYAADHSESSTAPLSFVAAIPLAIFSVVALWGLAWILARLLSIGASGVRRTRRASRSMDSAGP